MTKKILITGGCGFLGTHFVEHLLKNTSWDLTILDNLSYAGSLEHLMDIPVFREQRDRVHFIYHDFRAEFYTGNFEFNEYDYIVHLGAFTDVYSSIQNPKDFIDNNIIGTYNMLEYARKVCPEKFIFVSTDEVYGPVKRVNGEFELHKEDDPHKPSNPYSACLHPNTRILFGDGSEKEIRDVNVGDLVQSINQVTFKTESKRVTNVYKYEANELLEVSIRNRKILCTHQHKFFVKRLKRFGKGKLDHRQDISKVIGEWISACDLQDKDWVATVRTTKKIIDYDIDNQMSAFLGYFIGDGYIKTSHNKKTNTNQYFILLADEKKHFVEHYRDIIGGGTIFKHKTKNC